MMILMETQILIKLIFLAIVIAASFQLVYWGALYISQFKMVKKYRVKKLEYKLWNKVLRAEKQG